MELRRIAALWQFDAHFIPTSFFLVITSQPCAEAARLDPHDRVCSRIERSLSIEDLHPDRIFLETFTPPCNGLFNNVAKEALEPIYMRKCRTGENVRQMFPDGFIGLRRFGWHAGAIVTKSAVGPKCGVVWMTIQVDDSRINR